MNRREEIEAERRREADATLRRAETESEIVGATAMRSAGQRITDHFGGADAPAEDRVEVWGRRIGRILALGAVVLLIVHLVRTYGAG